MKRFHQSFGFGFQPVNLHPYTTGEREALKALLEGKIRDMETSRKAEMDKKLKVKTVQVEHIMLTLG